MQGGGIEDEKKGTRGGERKKGINVIYSTTNQDRQNPIMWFFNYDRND
jgi:hypothetical protein